MELNHVFGMFMSRPPPTRETIWPIRTWKADAKEYEKCLAMTEAREMTPDRLRHFAVHYRLQTEALAEEYKQLSERQNDYDDLLFQASDKIREEKEENDWLKGSYADAVKARDQQVNDWLMDNYANVVKARDQLVEYGLALQKYNRVCYKELHAQRETIWAQRETIKELEAREGEFARQLNEKTVENMNLEAKLQRKAEENAFLEAEVVEKSNQIRGLTAELADAKKALVSREQAEEAREYWWLYEVFEKDARGGEANVGPDASGMEVLEEAKEVGTNKQIEDKQTKKKGEKKKIGCKECGYQARTPFVLAKHMERKHSADVFSCDKCQFTSTSEYWFKQHAKAHNGKEINCDVCKKCFSSTRNLKAHKDGVHGLPKL